MGQVPHVPWLLDRLGVATEVLERWVALQKNKQKNRNQVNRQGALTVFPREPCGWSAICKEKKIAGVQVIQTWVHLCFYSSQGNGITDTCKHASDCHLLKVWWQETWHEKMRLGSDQNIVSVDEKWQNSVFQATTRKPFIRIGMIPFRIKIDTFPLVCLVSNKNALISCGFSHWKRASHSENMKPQHAGKVTKPLRRRQPCGSNSIPTSTAFHKQLNSLDTFFQHCSAPSHPDHLSHIP